MATLHLNLNCIYNQNGPLFGPEPYKHQKITKLNRNTPWMKYNKKITLLIIVSYLPWIILDSWKSKTSTNCFVRLVLLDSRFQILKSHAVFNCRAYTQRVDRIIPCKSSSFSIRDVASRSTTSIYWQNLPTHTSLYLPMHLQIMDFNYKNYNVKCGYCNCEFFFGGSPLPPLWTI
jgi:hypothetical protein